MVWCTIVPLGASEIPGPDFRAAPGFHEWLPMEPLRSRQDLWTQLWVSPVSSTSHSVHDWGCHAGQWHTVNSKSQDKIATCGDRGREAQYNYKGEVPLSPSGSLWQVTVTGRDYGRLHRRLLWEASGQSQNHPECTEHGDLRVYPGQLAGWT